KQHESGADRWHVVLGEKRGRDAWYRRHRAEVHHDHGPVDQRRPPEREQPRQEWKADPPVAVRDFAGWNSAEGGAATEQRLRCKPIEVRIAVVEELQMTLDRDLPFSEKQQRECERTREQPRLGGDTRSTVHVVASLRAVPLQSRLNFDRMRGLLVAQL